jgi:hypothetical protein
MKLTYVSPTGEAQLLFCSEFDGLTKKTFHKPCLTLKPYSTSFSTVCHHIAQTLQGFILGKTN